MKEYLRLLLVTGLLIGSAHSAYAENARTINYASHITSQETTKQQIQKTFDTWLAAVSSGSSDAVVKLYAKDAILLPTLSPKVHNTPELRKEYFDSFTAKENLKGTVNEEHIRVFGNTAINSGLYTFTFTKDGETVQVPARFSFVYRKTPQGWLIVDHHSSKLPEVH